MLSSWYGYGKSKDLTKRTESNKVFRNKAFNIENDPKYDGYQRGLGLMVYKFLDKKLSTCKWTS